MPVETGQLGRALEIEPVDAGEFETLAAFLDRCCQEGLARIDARQRAVVAASEQVGATVGAWRGPNGDEFREAFTTLSSAVQGAEPKGGEGYRALGELAEVARAVAGAVRDIQEHRRNRLQAVLGTADEWFQRGWTNVQDVVGLESDEDAERTRLAMDEANRVREEAERLIREQLNRWHTQCQYKAEAIAAAGSAYGGVPAEAPPALARHGEASYHEAAVTEDLQRRWLSAMVEPYLVRHADDPEALRAFWEQMSDDERIAVMTLRPDLVMGFLAPYLTENERRVFNQINKYMTAESTFEETVGVTVPLKLIDFHIEGVLSGRITYNSDGSVEVYVSAQSAAGIEFGLKDAATIGGGKNDRVGFTKRFASLRDFAAAYEQLQQAVRADKANPTGLLGETRRALAEVFGAGEQGWERARGAAAAVEVEYADGWTALHAGGAVDLGRYYNGADNEEGVYFTRSLDGRAGPVDVKAEADGRLYLKDGERTYARLTFTMSASASAPLLEHAGFTTAQLENMGIGDGQQGTVAVTVTTEATNANRDALTRLLTDVAANRLDPADLRALHEGSEVTVATTTGTAEREGVPANPFVDFEINESDSTTAHSFRKTPDGSYYRQGTL